MLVGSVVYAAAADVYLNTSASSAESPNIAQGTGNGRVWGIIDNGVDMKVSAMETIEFWPDTTLYSFNLSGVGDQDQQDITLPDANNGYYVRLNQIGSNDTLGRGRIRNDL